MYFKKNKKYYKEILQLVLSWAASIFILKIKIELPIFNNGILNYYCFDVTFLHKTINIF